jgi:hypothetical protein
MLKTPLAVLGCLLLCCCNPPAVPPAAANTDAGAALVEGEEMSAVFARVKEEIGFYLADSVEVERHWPQLLKDLQVHSVCGSEPINFEITQVHMEFDVENEVSAGVSGGFKVPVLSRKDVADLNASGSYSHDRTVTDSVTYNYYPPTLKKYLQAGLAASAHGGTQAASQSALEADRKTAVILPTLNALRDSLIKASANYPCFRNTQKSDPVNTISFKVALVDDGKGSGGFDIKVVNMGVSGERKHSGVNTITVSFRPSSASDLDAGSH